MKRFIPLAVGLALAATTTWVSPASAGLPVSTGPCGGGGTFTTLLRVDRDRLKTHKNDRRLVEVVLKNNCAGGYAATGWGYNPYGVEQRREMILVGPGVNVDWKGADLDRYKIQRNFQWQGGGGQAGGTLADYTCQYPTHLVTKDSTGRIKVVPYHPDASKCPK